MRLDLPARLAPRDISAAVADLAVFVGGPRPARGGGPGGRLANVRRFQDLWWNEVVAGYGVAEKCTGGRRTGTLAVRFYVTQKLASRQLKSPWRIPRRVAVRRRDGGVVELPTDVVTLPRRPAAQRTVFAGDSMGHFIGLNGTMGVAVRAKDGRRYALTCAHVVAPRRRDPLGEAVESPADFDGAAGAATMGTVADWTVLDPAGVNTVDAALVAPAAGVELSNGHLPLSPRSRLSTLSIAQLVGLVNEPVLIETQRGTVDGLIESTHNNLPFSFGLEDFRFSDVVSYAAATRSGDSGAAVLGGANRDVLGLHFAGGEGVGYAVLARTIQRAFAKYALALV
jgi:hypothetical protein